MGQAGSQEQFLVEYDEFLAMDGEKLATLAAGALGARFNMYTKSLVQNRVTGGVLGDLVSSNEDIRDLLENVIGMHYVPDQKLVVSAVKQLKKRGLADAERLRELRSPLNWSTRQLLRSHPVAFLSFGRGCGMESTAALLARKLHQTLRDVWSPPETAVLNIAVSEPRGLAKRKVALSPECLNLMVLLTKGCLFDPCVIEDILLAETYGITILLFACDQLAIEEWRNELGMGQYYGDMLPLEVQSELHSLRLCLQDCVDAVVHAMQCGIQNGVLSAEGHGLEEVTQKLTWTLEREPPKIRPEAERSKLIAAESRYGRETAERRVHELLEAEDQEMAIVNSLRAVTLLAGRDDAGRESLADAGVVEAVFRTLSRRKKGWSHQITYWGMRCIASLSRSDNIAEKIARHEMIMKAFTVAMGTLKLCVNVIQSLRNRTDGAASSLLQRAGRKVMQIQAANKMRHRLSIIRSEHFAILAAKAADIRKELRDLEESRAVREGEFLRQHGDVIVNNKSAEALTTACKSREEERNGNGCEAEDHPETDVKEKKRTKKKRKEKRKQALDAGTPDNEYPTMSTDEIESSEISFRALCHPTMGIIDFRLAASAFRRSGLDSPTLAKIWDQADADGDGSLSSREWASAMHLLRLAKEQALFRLPEYGQTRGENSPPSSSSLREEYLLFTGGKITTCRFFISVSHGFGPQMEHLLTKVIRVLPMEAAENLAAAAQAFVTAQEYRNLYAKEISDRKSVERVLLSALQSIPLDDEDGGDKADGQDGGSIHHDDGEAHNRTKSSSFAHDDTGRSIQLWTCRAMELLVGRSLDLTSHLIIHGASTWMASILRLFSAEKDGPLIAAALVTLLELDSAFSAATDARKELERLPSPLAAVESPSACQKMTDVLRKNLSSPDVQVAVGQVLERLLTSKESSARMAAMAVEPLILSLKENSHISAVVSCVIRCIAAGSQWQGIVNRLAQLGALNAVADVAHASSANLELSLAVHIARCMSNLWSVSENLGGVVEKVWAFTISSMKMFSWDSSLLLCGCNTLHLLITSGNFPLRDTQICASYSAAAVTLQASFDGESCTSACRAISDVCNLDESLVAGSSELETVISGGSCMEAVMKAMRKIAPFPAVTLACLTCAGDLLSSNVFGGASAFSRASSLIDHVLRAAAATPSHHLIQLQMCRILGLLVKAGLANLVMEAGGCEALTEASTLLRRVREAQLYFCQAVLGILNQEESSFELLSNCGVCHLAATACADFSDDPDLAGHACALIANLSRHPLAARGIAASIGAKAVIDAVRHHASCHLPGLEAFALFAASAPTVVENLGGLMRVITHALNSTESSEVAQAGCAAVATLCSLPKMRIEGAEVGAPQAVIDIMGKYTGNQKVVRYGCEALTRCLTLSGFNRVLIGTNHGAAALAQSLSSFPLDRSIQYFGCEGCALLCHEKDPSTISSDLLSEGFPKLASAALTVGATDLRCGKASEVSCAAAHALARLLHVSSAGRDAVQREVGIVDIIDSMRISLELLNVGSNMEPESLIHWCCVIMRGLSDNLLAVSNSESTASLMRRENLSSAAEVLIAISREKRLALHIRLAAMSAMVNLSEDARMRQRLNDADAASAILELLQVALEDGTPSTGQLACALCASLCGGRHGRKAMLNHSIHEPTVCQTLLDIVHKFPSDLRVQSEGLQAILLLSRVECGRLNLSSAGGPAMVTQRLRNLLGQMSGCQRADRNHLSSLVRLLEILANLCQGGGISAQTAALSHGAEGLLVALER
jgi:hypothetical protein